jgi:hypothetical protein
LEHSSIRGDKVIIQAPNYQLVIDEDSKVTSTGTSINTKGSSTDNVRGASYIASGGYCEDDTSPLTYSDFDLTPDSDPTDMLNM